MKNLKALGYDIFAGLFTLGVKQAGFDVVSHLEHCDYGYKTCKANFPDLDIRIGLKNWREDEFINKIDFMYANPPCAPWSSATAKSAEWRRDSRIQRVVDIVDCGLKINPKVWCFESVVNTYKHGYEFIIEQAQRFAVKGYSVTVSIQNNMYLGAPQNRKRMFLIAHKYPLIWQAFFKPKSVEQYLCSVKVKKSDKVFLKDNLKNIWENTTTSSSLRSASVRINSSIKPSFLAKKLMLKKPPIVLIRNSLCLHPSEPRYLTIDEWLVLCGLPTSWIVTSNSMDKATNELSRAVLPPVGKWLASAVKE